MSLYIRTRVDQFKHQLVLVHYRGFTVIIQRSMGFQIQIIAFPAQFVRLIDDAHFGAYGNHVGQLQYIVVQHAETAVADAHANAKLFVGTMDQVAR